MEAGGLVRAGSLAERVWTAHVPSLRKISAEVAAISLRNMQIVTVVRGS